jgi:UDP-N-acetyl-D-mannosaminuronic acid dehydrogenase
VTAPDLDLVVLGGGGHVGLPLSLAFAESGWRVGIYDINEQTLERIGRGEMPFMETGADELLPKILATGRLTLSSDPSIIARSDRLIVVVGTPVDEFLRPSMTIFERTSPRSRRTCATARSSSCAARCIPARPPTSPTSSRPAAVASMSRSARSGSPRATPSEELRALPQIIGADDDRAADRATELFKQLGPKTIRTSSKEAELAKLFTNTWRYMKFAVANQFLMIADQAGVDYSNILRAIREDYPRARDLPVRALPPGRACSRTRCSSRPSRPTTSHGPGRDAGQRGPARVIVSAMERRYGGLRGKTVGILGMAFKAESDDMRASLSYKLESC